MNLFIFAFQRLYLWILLFSDGHASTLGKVADSLEEWGRLYRAKIKLVRVLLITHDLEIF